MMFQIKVDKTIKLTRGDTAYMTVVLYSSVKAKVEYELQEGDTIKLSLKKTINDIEPLLEKTFLERQIKIESSDTALLPFGKYIYDVQLIFANGDINTVIEPSIFEVCGEVST